MDSKPHVIRLTFKSPRPTPSQQKKRKTKSRNQLNNSSTVQLNGVTRKTLALPCNWTIIDLKKEALSMCPEPKPQNKFSVELLMGYPPTPLGQNLDDCIARTYIPPNEALIVNIISNLDETSAKTKRDNSCDGKQNTSIESKISITGRKRREAAISASNNFSQIIEAQNKILQAEKKKSKKTKKIDSTKTNSSKNSNRFDKSRDTPQPLSHSDSIASKKLSKTVGRKLSDGSHVTPKIPRFNSKGKSSSTNLTFKDETDVATRLLSSIETGGNGKIGSFLRGAMRNAVTKSYESSRAYTRISAIQSRQYNIFSKQNIQLLGTTAENENEGRPSLGIFTVQYSKGKVSNERGLHEEDFQLISMKTLKSVIRAVYMDSDPEEGGKEMLRSRNMAQLSPRVLWSIVYHTMYIPSQQKGQNDKYARDIEEGLQILLPDLDWKYLRKRKQILSEKAKENLRQKESIENQDDDNEVIEKGMEIIDAVEAAMMAVSKEDKLVTRNKIAKAALSRSKIEDTSLEDQNPDNWELITPIDVDWDELVECICDGCDLDCKNAITIAKGLENHCTIRNWRELANGNATLIQNQLEMQIRDIQISTENIESWIDSAQRRSIDEIMIDICDDKTDVVFALCEKVNVGTPKDLALWEPITDLLLEEIHKQMNDNEKLTLNINEENVKLWCRRSKSLLKTIDWLNWYATPIA